MSNAPKQLSIKMKHSLQNCRIGLVGDDNRRWGAFANTSFLWFYKRAVRNTIRNMSMLACGPSSCTGNVANWVDIASVFCWCSPKMLSSVLESLPQRQRCLVRITHRNDGAWVPLGRSLFLLRLVSCFVRLYHCQPLFDGSGTEFLARKRS